MLMESMETLPPLLMVSEPSRIVSAATLSTALSRITSKPLIIASSGAAGTPFGFQFNGLVHRLLETAVTEKEKPAMAAPVVKPMSGISRKVNEPPSTRVIPLSAFVPAELDRFGKSLSTLPFETSMSPLFPSA